MFRQEQRLNMDVWSLKSAQENVLTHFEVCGLQGGTREEPGEHHVDGDGQSMADIALRDLDVLDLCGISRVPFSAAWGKRPLKNGAAATNGPVYRCNNYCSVKDRKH